MAMKMGKAKTQTKTKGEMKTGLEGLNVIVSRLNQDKPSMPIIFDPKWQQFVGKSSLRGIDCRVRGHLLMW